MRRVCFLLVLALTLALSVPPPGSLAGAWPAQDRSRPASGSSQPAHAELAPPAIVAGVPSWGLSSPDSLCASLAATIPAGRLAGEPVTTGRTCYAVPSQSRRFPLQI